MAATLNLQDATLGQVIDLYENVGGRTVIRPNNLPETRLSLRSEKDVTRAEAAQALETILAMNQLTTIPQGERFVKVVAQHQATTEAKPFLAPLDLIVAPQNQSQLYTITPNDSKHRVEVGTMAPLAGVSVSRSDSSLLASNDRKFGNSSLNGTTVAADTGVGDIGAPSRVADRTPVSARRNSEPGPLPTSTFYKKSLEEQKKQRHWGLTASTSSGNSPATVYSLN